MRHAALVVCVVALVAGLTQPAPAPVGATPGFTVHAAHQARHAPPPPDAPFFVLVVGNDHRPELPGIRGDALHVIGVNPATRQATILNIPRDTWTDIPGLGTDKINAAYDRGGLAKQAEAVSAFVGVPIAFVVEVGFDGFADLVDALGGIPIELSEPMVDRSSGADFPAGPNRLGGAAALAFARNRNFRDGDISRTTNQGRLLIAALGELRAQTVSPFGVVRLVGLVGTHVQLQGIEVGELYAYVALALEIDPAAVRNVTVPSRQGRVGRTYVVFTRPEASSLFADFRDDAVLQSH